MDNLEISKYSFVKRTKDCNCLGHAEIAIMASDRLIRVPSVKRENPEIEFHFLLENGDHLAFDTNFAGNSDGTVISLEPDVRKYQKILKEFLLYDLSQPKDLMEIGKGNYEIRKAGEDDWAEYVISRCLN